MTTLWEEAREELTKEAALGTPRGMEPPGTALHRVRRNQELRDIDTPKGALKNVGRVAKRTAKEGFYKLDRRLNKMVMDNMSPEDAHRVRNLARGGRLGKRTRKFFKGLKMNMPGPARFTANALRKKLGM